MPRRDVDRTWLEMLSPDQLRPAPKPEGEYEIRLESPCSVSLSKHLYSDVGKAYFWRDRNVWSDEQLAEYLARPDIRVYVLWHKKKYEGFFELRRHEDASVEIVYFGLVADAHGKGLGKWMLASAVEEAWRLGAKRVWLNTCTLDSRAALPNYLSRGFVPFRTDSYAVDIPAAEGRG